MDNTPVRLDFTNSSSLIYNADNRNTRATDVASQADDRWGMWYNRFNAQSSWKKWRLGVRMDSALFYTSRSPTDIALKLLELRRSGETTDGYTSDDANFFVQKFNQAGQELSTRFVNWVYPSKYYLTYSTENFEATAGDLYAQFGRGLVLSLRKRDEMSSDTTLRGLRVSGKIKADDIRFKLTAMGGTLNPLRIDEASGRSLGVTSDVTSGVSRVTELGMPRAIKTDFIQNPRPTYAPDRLAGLELTAKGKQVSLSLHGIKLNRTCLEIDGKCQTLNTDVSRAARSIETGGVALEFPSLWKSGAAYIEYAGQRLSDFSTLNSQTRQGSALYGSLNWTWHAATLTLEGKHYRSFFPLRGNVNLGSAREFSPVQYSLPPTTEAIWNDTQFEGFNTCVTGGKAKVDVVLNRHASVFGWVGRYNTWAETNAAGSCQTTDDNLNRVWDFAEGVNLSSNDRHTRALITVGTRFDSTARLIADARGETDVFYRELYTRYDIVKSLGGDMALQFQGWHRRRRLTLGGPAYPWLQGITSNSLQWGPKLTLTLGLEYDQNPAFPNTYVNGQIRYNIDASNNISLFVGQRQGGLRCVSGICRIFPPFEGARLDATLRF